MFRFLLKKKFGFFENGLLTSISFTFFMMLYLCFFALLALNINFIYNIDHDFIAIFGFFISMPLSATSITTIMKIIEKYRENNPYNTEIVIENNKKLEVKYFPALYKKEYYYNGKLHREDKPAIVIENINSYDIYNLLTKQDTFCLFGKQYENKSEFDKAKEKLLIHDKIGNF